MACYSKRFCPWCEESVGVQTEVLTSWDLPMFSRVSYGACHFFKILEEWRSLKNETNDSTCPTRCQRKLPHSWLWNAIHCQINSSSFLVFWVLLKYPYLPYAIRLRLGTSLENSVSSSSLENVTKLGLSWGFFLLDYVGFLFFHLVFKFSSVAPSTKILDMRPWTKCHDLYF